MSEDRNPFLQGPSSPHNSQNQESETGEDLFIIFSPKMTKSIKVDLLLAIKSIHNFSC